MSNTKGIAETVIVVGAGIGGLACALALAKRGLRVDIVEQSSHIHEIGAGMQLGPNGLAALDELGMGHLVRENSVFVERLVMMDAIDCSEVASIPLADAFRNRFNNPYVMVHRADLHRVLYDAVCAHPAISVHTGVRIRSVDIEDHIARVTGENGRIFQAQALIGCDGVKSVVRQFLIGDDARVSGHVVYRAVVPAAQMPIDMRLNSPVLWAGPQCHLVHYPLRDRSEYNLVIVFHSRLKESWGVTDGTNAELAPYFESVHSRPRRLLTLPTSWRRWSTADRDPVAKWTYGCATLLGDAAHPMLQYLAQGACMALEDAVTLGMAFDAASRDIIRALQIYERARIVRTARVVLSVREMGRIMHASGVERLVRNSLWRTRSTQRHYDALEWLYAWRPETCLEDATQDDAISASLLEHPTLRTGTM